MLRFKVETHVGTAAEQTFQLLSDLRRRKEWDQHYKLVPRFKLGCFQIESAVIQTHILSHTVKIHREDDLDRFFSNAGSVRRSCRWTKKTPSTAWPRHLSAKRGKTMISSCWRRGGSRATPGAVPNHMEKPPCSERAEFVFNDLFDILRCALCWTPQGSIFDRPAICHVAHPSTVWRIHPGRGALCWLHDQGRFQQSHQGRPNAGKGRKRLFPCSVWPDVLAFRSLTTTRPHQEFSPTSPQISSACPPSFTAPSPPAASSWRPTRMFKQPRPCDTQASPQETSSSLSSSSGCHNSPLAKIESS